MNTLIRSKVGSLCSAVFWTILLILVPLGLAEYALGFNTWDLSVPLLYGDTDHIWQLVLNKALYQTGWILTNPYLGAPEVASWHHNAAAQTSALHSVLMLLLSNFLHDSVQMQQTYYLLNFPLICLTSFLACRLLGVSHVPAFCVGLLFAFTKFRIDEMLYSYIPNYFMVPLALVAVVWILTDRFAVFFAASRVNMGIWTCVKRLLGSRDFILGLIFVLLTAVADGYYSFFTLLLLGFAACARVVLGDWRRPVALLPVGIYIAALMTSALLLQLPLHNYKSTHWSEFHPNGVEDSALSKRPFEAEVYSSSLKLLLAPIEHHRIEVFSTLGKWMGKTSNEARRFEVGNYWPLGSLGSVLFCISLAILALPAVRTRFVTNAYFYRSIPSLSVPPKGIGDALLSLTFFIFLCSISGGIGTLVALVFPTIRAYNRFPVFLIFILYLGAALFVTLKIRNSERVWRVLWIMLTVLVTVAALYDQMPKDAYKGDATTKAKFLAERDFVQRMERTLPRGAMVYQYPYSQYLRENKSYGWGSFAHIRLFLHSRELRWSNGGAKNSAADDWNFRISQLPLEDLIAEVEAVGFSGLVIDGTVIKPDEYERIRRTFVDKDYEVLTDLPSKLTFVRLSDPGFRLAYDSIYREVDRVLVTDPARVARSEIPGLIEADALRHFIASQTGKTNYVIRKADNPELFLNAAVLTRGLGQVAIVPISDVQGRMACELETIPGKAGSANILLLTISNQSDFDWKFNQGSFPIGIGVHVRQPDGKLLQFDDGFRIPTDAYIRHATRHTIRFSLNTLPLNDETSGSGPLVGEFALVQDGNAWMNSINCTIALR